MADINYGVTVRVEKDFLSNSVAVPNATATMAVVGMKSDIYELSGTATNLTTSTMSAVGLAFFRNLATATVATCSIGVVSAGNFVSFATLRAGEPAVLRLATGVDYQAKGTVGTRLRVDITEG